MRRVEVDSRRLSGADPSAADAADGRAQPEDHDRLGLQRESEKALLEGIENARAGGKPATAGGFVAIDPLNGEVLAIGSWPTFDPNKFAKPLTYARIRPARGQRRSNRPAR